MLLSEFLDCINDKAPPAPKLKLWAFEASLQTRLPEDYRSFLVACNGGHVGGALWFNGPTADGKSADAGVHHIGGFRQEDYFSLSDHQRCYKGRIPKDTIWIMDDPFGNAICLGVRSDCRGKVYFWDHEEEPDEVSWDGSFETAGNITLLTNNFADFVAGLKPNEEDAAEQQG